MDKDSMLLFLCVASSIFLVLIGRLINAIIRTNVKRPVQRMCLLSAVRGLFFTPAIIAGHGIAIFPTIVVLLLIPWWEERHPLPALFFVLGPAAIVFLLSLATEIAIARYRRASSS
jgi:hypothetical protein